jgi:hypothetical protein
VTPKPHAQHEARTTFIRVPAVDWLLVKHGRKTEFRVTDTRLRLDWVKCPTPVVAYTTSERGVHRDSQLMVLERVWREPVGSISEESVLREGYDSFADFRRYFKLRTHRPFRPMQDVWCFRVRPWRQDDLTTLGTILLTRLYGEHLP